MVAWGVGGEGGGLTIIKQTSAYENKKTEKERNV